MTDDEEHTYRAFITERRERLRQLYARYRDMGSQMFVKGLVRWTDHGYACEFELDRSYKERQAIGALKKLQLNIQQQAMLLLEMEHAIDCEKKKEVA